MSTTAGATVAVCIQVTLSSRERNRLFLSGDVLIQLPCDGAIDVCPSGQPERTSMFLSEIAGSKSGLTRLFGDTQSAGHFAAVIEEQLDRVERSWSTS